MITRTLIVSLALLLAPPVMAADNKTVDGKPNLDGQYGTATQTPLERPKEYGDNLYLTKDQAREFTEKRQAYLKATEEEKSSDPNRKAPPKGGDGK